MYNMSNLSKTLNKVGEDVSTSRQYGLKWGRAEGIICRIYQKPLTSSVGGGKSRHYGLKEGRAEGRIYKKP